MLGKNLVETIMGAFVLLVAAMFLGFAYFSADLSPSGGYPVTAQFSSVDGLSPGSDVRIGGVKVGIVSSQSVDQKDYRARVTMDLQPSVKLPTDTKAEIASAGLLGGSYVKIVPGHAATFIAPGGEIKNTQGAIVLEELLGKIIFLATDQGGPSSGGPSSGAQAPAPNSGTPSPGTPSPSMPSPGASGPGTGNGAPTK
ncbi:MAG TPA: outer membrane lipid asymmetry maintenance protein MlaD [Alphaproteobacteria bacterium]|nr:outer membrane lipid asymmetry maintenance protein MlaD [Alphaproteobacteria bacterium]